MCFLLFRQKNKYIMKISHEKTSNLTLILPMFKTLGLIMVKPKNKLTGKKL